MLSGMLDSDQVKRKNLHILYMQGLYLLKKYLSNASSEAIEISEKSNTFLRHCASIVKHQSDLTSDEH